MTRKHFKELASIINKNNVDVDLLIALIKFCKSQNSNFDMPRFVDACGFTVNEVGNFKRIEPLPQPTCINGAVHESQEITTILNDDDDMEFQFRSPDLFKM
jgi:hypothetical protein